MRVVRSPGRQTESPREPLSSEEGEGSWGLVLTGGANWGAVQVGALQALLEHGLSPRFIVGVSVGAINGSYLAARPTLEGIAELAALWEEADSRRIFGTPAVNRGHGAENRDDPDSVIGRLALRGAGVLRHSRALPTRGDRR